MYWSHRISTVTRCHGCWMWFLLFAHWMTMDESRQTCSIRPYSLKIPAMSLHYRYRYMYINRIGYRDRERYAHTALEYLPSIGDIAVRGPRSWVEDIPRLKDCLKNWPTCRINIVFCLQHLLDALQRSQRFHRNRRFWLVERFSFFEIFCIWSPPLFRTEDLQKVRMLDWLTKVVLFDIILLRESQIYSWSEHITSFACWTANHHFENQLLCILFCFNFFCVCVQLSSGIL